MELKDLIIGTKYKMKIKEIFHSIEKIGVFNEFYKPKHSDEMLLSFDTITVYTNEIIEIEEVK